MFLLSIISCIRDLPLFSAELLITSVPSPYSNAELSAESEYSVRHISRLYNEVYGIGAKDFIKMYRFQNVLAAIIADPERDNSSFIEGAGYSDQAHFQREFRTFMGMTPKKYIKLIKNF